MKKKLFSVLCLLFVLNVLLINGTFASEQTTLKFLTKPSINDFGKWSDGLMWIKGDDNASYIDQNGKAIIDVKAIHEKILLEEMGKELYQKYLSQGLDINYLILNDFSEGIANTNYEGSSTYIDKNGSKIFNSNYNGYNFSEGVAFLSGPLSSENFISDTKGNIKTLQVNRGWEVYWNELHEGKFIFQSTLEESIFLKGYMDKNTKTIISAKFDDARPFNQGLAFVKKDEKWGIINTSGNYIINPTFDDFKVKYKDYVIYNNGLAAVKKDGKWGYIDKNGKTVVDFIYDDANIFYDNLASVQLNGKWALINNKGNLLSDFSWDKISPFLDGYAFVKNNGKYGYINTSGDIVISLKFDDANFFSNGISLVKYDGLYGLIDKSGNFISEERWYLEGSNININSPNMIMYKFNGKWGLAKYSPTGEKGLSIDLKAKTYSNLANFNFTDYQEWEGGNGISYTITNTSKIEDSGRKCIFINGYYPELHFIEYDKLMPGESISGVITSKSSGKSILDKSIDSYIMNFDDEVKYVHFRSGVLYQDTKSNPFSSSNISKYIISDGTEGRAWIEKHFNVKRTGPERKY